MISLNALHGRLAVIFGTFGKPAPSVEVQRSILRQVENLPEEFLDWAASEMARELDALPANVGRYLARTLWPEYRRLNAQRFARAGAAGCRECSGRHGLAGAGFYAFLRLDERGRVDESRPWSLVFCPCPCAEVPGGREPGRVRRWTAREIRALGGHTLPDSWSGTPDGFQRRLNGLEAASPQAAAEAGAESRGRDGGAGAAAGEILDGMRCGKFAPEGADPARFGHLGEEPF